jgi:hypothetical protein
MAGFQLRRSYWGYRDSQGIAGFMKAFDCSKFEIESGAIMECVFWKQKS